MKSILSLFFSVLLATVASAVEPKCPYQEWRVSPFPAGDTTLHVNPVALLWPSEKYLHNEDVLYNVYLSRDKNFSDASTMTSKAQRACFYNPHRALQPGKWYWKYEILRKNPSSATGYDVTDTGINTFTVASDSKGLETPTANEFIAGISHAYPRVINYGRPMADIRRDAPSHPLYKSMISRAEKCLASEPYDGPVGDSNPALERKYLQKAGKEVEMFHSLLEAYILTGRDDIYDALMERTRILLTWPTDDLLGSKVLSALSYCYDALNDKLSAETKQKIEQIADRQFRHGLSKWPGYTEARHVENHFWQMELAGNFKASIIMLDRIESAREMLAYTYGLFIARFPNLAEQDGGWAEGEGYYSVNKTAIVDMALLMKKVGGIDVFRMEWYRQLTDYLTYFSPVASPVSGFGDMHDRVASGSLKGHSEMLVLGCEEDNPYSLYRLFASFRPDNTYYGAELKKNYWKKPLAEVEPWYQIVNNIIISPSDGAAPHKMSHDKVFLGTGAAALHTDVLSPDRDATVFFRSSPFGAKGHMHANQNAFNISRRGERIFYSTGFYTSFSDPHSLTSYRHTRAHNTILIDGMGQAFGHEGYGHIIAHNEGRHISYICGDASHAYRPVTDKQFLGFLEEHKITEGFGETGLKKFIRHLFFVRPGIVVVYDELEADCPVTWSSLLHTVLPSSPLTDTSMRVETDRTVASAHVYGSTKLKGEFTDSYYSPAIDFKKKYPKGTPLSYHYTYSNAEKTRSMRFLTIIQLEDKGTKLPKIKTDGKRKWTIGDTKIEAEMDASRPAAIKVSCKGEIQKGR